MSYPTSDAKALPWRWLGRAVMPGSLILSVVTAVLGLNAVLGRTSHLDGAWEDIAGMIALLTAGALWAGWWGRSLLAMLAGLIGAVWTWSFTAVTVVAATGDPFSLSAWISGCWAMLAGLLWLRDRRETR